MDNKGKVWFALAMSVAYLMGFSFGFLFSDNWGPAYIMIFLAAVFNVAWMYVGSHNRFDIITLDKESG